MLVLTVNICYHKYTSVLYTVRAKRMGPLIIKVFDYSLKSVEWPAILDKFHLYYCACCVHGQLC